MENKILRIIENAGRERGGPAAVATTFATLSALNATSLGKVIHKKKY